MRVMMMKMMMMMMMKALQLDQTRVKAQKAEDTIQVLLGQLNLILKMMSKVRRNHRILMHLRPNNIQLLLNWLANSLDTRDVDYFTSSMPNMNDLDTSEHSSMTFLKQDEEACLRLKDTDNAHIPKVTAATWFKPIPEDERPATPEPEWTIPRVFPGPENNWANLASSIEFVDMPFRCLRIPLRLLRWQERFASLKTTMLDNSL
ncbi:hypothetical protein Tco_1562005 [Tanacetum coccineum]